MPARVLGTLLIGSDEYVVLPRAEYLRDRRGGDDAAIVLGRKLRAARDHAGLTQAALARKLRRSQSTISQAESGAIHVSGAYVERLFKVCRAEDDGEGAA